jgi:DDE superfamily endonuclease
MAIPRCPEDWSEWGDWLAAGLHGRCRHRLAILLVGILFAQGRRTAASWLRAAGVTEEFKTYYYFIAGVGRKVEWIARRLLILILARIPTGPRLVFALDDTPTKRYGPHVEGAGIHHNPTPGPADAKYVYGHIWVTLVLLLRHSKWGTLALPILSRLYIRSKDVPKLPKYYRWSFQTKLQQAVGMMQWLAGLAVLAGKRLWIVADGFYAKRLVLKAARTLNIVVVSRLRKDAKLFSVPPALKPGERRGRGGPRKYGTNRISLAKRAGQPGGWQTVECVQYGARVTKKVKTFLATYQVAYGLIRVVIVQETAGPQHFFCTDPNASVAEILEVFADRAAIEQVFHDVKEVEGAGQQQVRHLWASIGAWHLNLWSYTLLELWAWIKPKRQICNRRASPWDDPDRRPSHADRRKALRRWLLRDEFSTRLKNARIPPRIHRFVEKLLALAT